MLFGISCPNYRKFQNEYFESSAFVPLQKRLPEFITYISEHTGANYTNAGEVNILHSILVQEVNK